MSDLIEKVLMIHRGDFTSLCTHFGCDKTAEHFAYGMFRCDAHVGDLDPETWRKTKDKAISDTTQPKVKAKAKVPKHADLPRIRDWLVANREFLKAKKATHKQAALEVSQALGIDIGVSTIGGMLQSNPDIVWKPKPVPKPKVVRVDGTAMELAALRGRVGVLGNQLANLLGIFCRLHWNNKIVKVELDNALAKVKEVL